MPGPLIAGAVALALIALAFALAHPLARRRLASAAARPSDGRRPDRDLLKQRLRELDTGDGPVAVEERGDRITVTWRLVGIPWATLLFRKKLRTTWAVDLEITSDGRALARVRRGKVSWTSPAATWMPRAEVEWSVPWFPPLPDPPAPGPETDAAPDFDADAPRDAVSLIRTVRQCAVASGHRFMPVLVFPT